MPLSKQDRQTFFINEYFNTAGDARLSPDEASAFEREHHLVGGRWADSEVALHIGFGRWPAVQARVCVDKRQILALFEREGFC
jgi:hypothetical protein